jgi:hypothetical protein
VKLNIKMWKFFRGVSNLPPEGLEPITEKVEVKGSEPSKNENK